TIAQRVGAGLTGDEFVTALAVGRGAAGPGEIRIGRCRVLVALVDVTAARIGLPDLDERVEYWPAVLVEHAPVHDDALAERLAGVLRGEIVVAWLDAVVAVNRSGQLGK